MSCQVFSDKTDARGPAKLPGTEIDADLRNYDTSGGKHITKFWRISNDGTRKLIWKCFCRTKDGNKCRFVDFSASHMKSHIYKNHCDNDPPTLPENDVMIKKKKPRRSVPHNQRKILINELTDQPWKYQDSYVPKSPSAEVDVDRGVEEGFFYDESGMSGASTTDTTPNKHDSKLGLHPLVLESALEQIAENSFVDSLFAE
jgi:hypothetical protein